MLLSVIVPIYNVEQYVARCLNLLLQQNLTDEDYEILVMDDGSSDKSYSLAKSYADRFKNIFLFNQHNAGPCIARNTLLKQARGEYIYCLDADDMIALNTLGVLVRLAKKHALDIIGFNTMITPKIENFEPTITLSLPEEPIIYSGYQYLGHNPSLRFEIWWYIVKASLLRDNEIDFGENQYNGDVLFTLKTFSSAHRVVHIPTPLHCYFQSKGSIMRNKEYRHRQTLIGSFHKMICNFSGFITRLEGKDIPHKTRIVKNLENRRNIFVRSFLTKLVRSNIDTSQAKNYLLELRKVSVYPLKSPIHSSMRFSRRLLVYLLNNQSILLSIMRIKRFRYGLSHPK